MAGPPPAAARRLAILRRARTIAVVGASSNPARASNFVLTYLLSSSADYEVWPISPREDEILGVRTYPSLDALPGGAREAVAANAKVFWMQLGLHNDEAVEIAYSAGLQVVSNRCVKIEHARFHGGLHLAGVDTGVISSRRPRG